MFTERGLVPPKENALGGSGVNESVITTTSRRPGNAAGGA